MYQYYQQSEKNMSRINKIIKQHEERKEIFIHTDKLNCFNNSFINTHLNFYKLYFQVLDC